MPGKVAFMLPGRLHSMPHFVKGATRPTPRHVLCSLQHCMCSVSVGWILPSNCCRACLTQLLFWQGCAVIQVLLLLKTWLQCCFPSILRLHPFVSVLYCFLLFLWVSVVSLPFESSLHVAQAAVFCNFCSTSHKQFQACHNAILISIQSHTQGSGQSFFLPLSKCCNHCG